MTKWLLAALVGAAVLGANAHLLYVAVASQPDCIDHLKEKGTAPGEYRAASPSC